MKGKTLYNMFLVLKEAIASMLEAIASRVKTGNG